MQNQRIKDAIPNDIKNTIDVLKVSIIADITILCKTSPDFPVENTELRRLTAYRRNIITQRNSGVSTINRYGTFP